MSEMSDIGLSEMVLALRQELMQAQQEGENKDLKFHVEQIELEVDVLTTKEETGKGGVKFWVCNAEAQAKFVQAKTHKLRLMLKPLSESTPNGALKISRRNRG